MIGSYLTITFIFHGNVDSEAFAAEREKNIPIYGHYRIEPRLRFKMSVTYLLTTAMSARHLNMDIYYLDYDF